MLVLTGAEVLVLNVAALEAAEAAAAGGDMSLAVLRLISYREVRTPRGWPMLKSCLCYAVHNCAEQRDGL